jgi:hypothetical protein
VAKLTLRTPSSFVRSRAQHDRCPSSLGLFQTTHGVDPANLAHVGATEPDPTSTAKGWTFPFRCPVQTLMSYGWKVPDDLNPNCRDESDPGTGGSGSCGRLAQLVRAQPSHG